MDTSFNNNNKNICFHFTYLGLFFIMQLKFPINIRFLHLLLLNTKRKKQIKLSWILSHCISSVLDPLLFPSREGSMRISEMFLLFLQHLFMLNYTQCASSKVKKKWLVNSFKFPQKQSWIFRKTQLKLERYKKV